jgi:rhomboid-related protein 1/2/3
MEASVELRGSSPTAAEQSLDGNDVDYDAEAGSLSPRPKARFSRFSMTGVDPATTDVVEGPKSPRNLTKLHSHEHAEHPDEFDKHVVHHKSVISDHMKKRFHSTRTSGKLHSDPKIEKLELVGFMKGLARGLHLHMHLKKHCISKSRKITLWPKKDFSGFWFIKPLQWALPGCHVGIKRTVCFFHGLVNVVPVETRAHPAIPGWHVPPEQADMTDDIYARSFLLQFRREFDHQSQDHEDNLRTLMITADSIEACYRLCTNFMLAKKYARMLEEHSDELTGSVLKIAAPHPPCLLTPLLVLHNLYKPPYHPEHRKAKLQIGLTVEVSYYDHICLKTTFSNGHRGQVKIPVKDSEGELLFGPGKYCTARIESYDEYNDRYTLKYLNGPFDHDEEPNHDEDAMLFAGDAEFIDVDRMFLEVELSEGLISHPPFFIFMISVWQIFLFFAYCITTGETATSSGPTAGKPYLWFKLVGDGYSTYGPNGDYPICNDLTPQFWRFWSYQFVHSGTSHLGFNMFLQLLLGIPLEMVHGSVRMMFLYEAGVYLGAITCAMTDVYTMVVGASGGVYCIIGIHLANLIMNWDEMKRGMFNHWTILLLISAFVALEIYQYQQHNDGTSLSAHYGGATAGLCLGMLFLRNPNLEFHEKYFLIPLAAIGTVMFVLGGTSWVFSTWPPSYVFHLESKTYAGRSCCWQVARCDGLSEDDYNLFKCKTSSVSRGDYDDLTKSTLWADGRLYDNCPDMLNYSNWKSGGSAYKQ